MTSAPGNESRLSDALASVLRSGRAEFNRQFAEARRLHPDLDAAAFSGFLRSEVDGLIRAVASVNPDRVTEVVMAAYEAGLELVSHKLVGPGARHGFIAEGWRRVLTPLAPLVVQAPARVIGAVSNALHNLANTPGARPDQWIADLERLGPRCNRPGPPISSPANQCAESNQQEQPPSPATPAEALLRLGQIAAWRAGLAHLRQGAIAAADTLPPALVLEVLESPASGAWPDLRQRLLANPWFDPAKPQATANPTGFRIMTQAGAFRGFGGLFVEPPLVARAGSHFLIWSGQDCWLLTADLYGATFHRASLAEFESAMQHPQLPPALRISDTKVIWGDQRFEIPSLGKYTSAAANDNTLALTSEFTHAVVLVALKSQS